MAIAGAATQSFEAFLEDGKLILRRQALRLNVETSPAVAYHRLLAGETIFLHSFHPTVAEVMQLVGGER